MKRLSLVTAGALSLAACFGSLEPAPERKYGFIIMDARAVAGNFETLPIGIFHRSPPLILPDPAPRDFCFEGRHDSTATGLGPSLNNIDPGPFISMKTGSDSANLVPFDTLRAEVYRPRAPVRYTPGDSVVFRGAGGADLPAFEIRAKTAEPFTMQPVGLPAAGANLPLSWTASPSPGSKMIVSLRWKNENEPNTTYLLYCDLRDDGAFSIPSTQLTGWRGALTRQVIATRERVAAPVTSGVTLRVISNFEIAVPVNQ